MTAVPETKFTCDRCRKEEYVPTNTNPPPHARLVGPNHWLTVMIGTEPGAPAMHLCSVCAPLLARFMSNE